MLTALTPAELLEKIAETFKPLDAPPERVSVYEAAGRVLFSDVAAAEYLPSFERSTVDGFALRAADTFGCSYSIPAVLKLTGEVLMGESPDFEIKAGECARIPTGGELPAGSDAVAMLEYCEKLAGEIALSRPAAPGENVTRRGEDAFPGKVILSAGRVLTASDVGALAALGFAEVPVRKKPRVGIISTGDELVAVAETPKCAEIRDVNSALLSAAVAAFGGEPQPREIIRDGRERLERAVDEALPSLDMLLISGGSSVGLMDSTAAVLAERGEILAQGVAMRPGKPTIAAAIGAKPVFGLPGHPGAAYFTAELFVRAAVEILLGAKKCRAFLHARLAEKVSANDGRELFMPVRLEAGDPIPTAVPLRAKSGVITALAGCDGYLRIPRDCEGCAAGSTVTVFTEV